MTSKGQEVVAVLWLVPLPVPVPELELEDPPLPEIFGLMVIFRRV